MINKQHVGSRLASLRRVAGYSQTLLAERLNVSPQAVSKWENGASLPDVEILLAISKLFMVSINELLEGSNPIPKLTDRPFTLTDGISYFLPEEERDYTSEYVVEAYQQSMSVWAQELVDKGWIKRNWEHAKQNRGWNQSIVKAVVDHGGLILELGAVPGGGITSRLLVDHPDANIVLSDYSPTVVREWKRLFDNEYFPPTSITLCWIAAIFPSQMLLLIS